MAKIIQFQKNDWYQIKISLNHIEPNIWRRFVVGSNIELPDLHKVIQTVMGWTNSHLHQFVINGKFYSKPDEESFLQCVDYRDVKLSQVLSEEGQSIIYEYDFGDGWEHEIALEKMLYDHSQKYPYCLAGKRHCPPEDCGGPWGYEDLLKVISDPNHSEYNEMIDWLSDNFDPEFIDIDQINEMLKEKDYGCLTLD